MVLENENKKIKNRYPNYLSETTGVPVIYYFQIKYPPFKS